MASTRNLTRLLEQRADNLVTKNKMPRISEVYRTLEASVEELFGSPDQIKLARLPDTFELNHYDPKPLRLTPDEQALAEGQSWAQLGDMLQERGADYHGQVLSKATHSGVIGRLHKISGEPDEQFRKAYPYGYLTAVKFRHINGGILHQIRYWREKPEGNLSSAVHQYLEPQEEQPNQLARKKDPNNPFSLPLSEGHLAMLRGYLETGDTTHLHPLADSLIENRHNLHGSLWRRALVNGYPVRSIEGRAPTNASFYLTPGSSQFSIRAEKMPPDSPDKTWMARLFLHHPEKESFATTQVPISKKEMLQLAKAAGKHGEIKKTRDYIKNSQHKFYEGPDQLSRISVSPATAYVSPSDRENSTLEQALPEYLGDKHRELNSIARKLNPTLDVHSGIGVWKDGSSESSAIEGQPNKIHKIAALLGLKYNQKSVGVFTPSADGKSTRYILHYPDTHIGKVIQEFKESGIDHATHFPNTESHVIGDDSLQGKIYNLARILNAKVFHESGISEFPGGNTREEAARVFREILNTKEEPKKLSRMAGYHVLTPDQMAIVHSGKDGFLGPLGDKMQEEGDQEIGEFVSNLAHKKVQISRTPSTTITNRGLLEGREHGMLFHDERDNKKPNLHFITPGENGFVHHTRVYWNPREQPDKLSRLDIPSGHGGGMRYHEPAPLTEEQGALAKNQSWGQLGDMLQETGHPIHNYIGQVLSNAVNEGDPGHVGFHTESIPGYMTTREKLLSQYPHGFFKIKSWHHALNPTKTTHWLHYIDPKEEKIHSVAWSEK